MSTGGRFLASQPEKKGKGWVRTVLIILAVILALGLIIGGFAFSKLNKIKRAQMGDNNLSAGDLAGLLVEETTEATETEPTETTEPKPLPRTTAPPARLSMCCSSARMPGKGRTAKTRTP